MVCDADLYFAQREVINFKFRKLIGVLGKSCQVGSINVHGAINRDGLLIVFVNS